MLGCSRHDNFFFRLNNRHVEIYLNDTSTNDTMTTIACLHIIVQPLSMMDPERSTACLIVMASGMYTVM